jgi:hypothetical protein
MTINEPVESIPLIAKNHSPFHVVTTNAVSQIPKVEFDNVVIDVHDLPKEQPQPEKPQTAYQRVPLHLI